MFVRVVRFTDVTAERVESLVAGIDESGPPPGVPIKKLQVVFDERQGTAGLSFSTSTTRRICESAPRASPRWIRQRRPAVASRWTRVSSRWSVRSEPGRSLRRSECGSSPGVARCLQCQP